METDPNDKLFGSLVVANRKCIDRGKLIKENINFEIKGKRFFDFGTNVGWFCFYFDSLGATVKGVDYDRGKIEFNKLLSEKFKIDCEFECSKIDIDFVDKMEEYDVVLGLSIFHLFFTQHGYTRDMWIELMTAICNKVRMVFVIEVSTDVFGPLGLGNYEDFIVFMKNIGNFDSVKSIGRSLEGRPLIMCERIKK
jgi:hypothetical protein